MEDTLKLLKPIQFFFFQSDYQHAQQKNNEFDKCLRALVSLILTHEQLQSTSANNVCMHGSEFPYRCAHTPFEFVLSVCAYFILRFRKDSSLKTDTDTGCSVGHLKIRLLILYKVQFLYVNIFAGLGTVRFPRKLQPVFQLIKQIINAFLLGWSCVKCRVLLLLVCCCFQKPLNLDL